MNLVRGWKLFTAAVVLGGALLFSSQTAPVVASDHDDGETNIKSRNLSLTDLYVFREDWQTGGAGGLGAATDNQNLIVIMNTNPRSLPRQQYFFNTEALYNISFGRIANVDDVATGREDMRFEFNFGTPSATTNNQTFSMSVHSIVGGSPATTATVTNGTTTAAPPLIGNPNPTPVTNSFTINGSQIDVFAGLREDPFFFDVEGFFRTRATLTTPAAGLGPGFSPIDQANDFAQGYNVNAIVMRVPIAFLQAGGTNTVFDVWEWISLPNDLAARQ